MQVFSTEEQVAFGQLKDWKREKNFSRNYTSVYDRIVPDVIMQNGVTVKFISGGALR